MCGRNPHMPYLIPKKKKKKWCSWEEHFINQFEVEIKMNDLYHIKYCVSSMTLCIWAFTDTEAIWHTLPIDYCFSTDPITMNVGPALEPAAFLYLLSPSKHFGSSQGSYPLQHISFSVNTIKITCLIWHRPQNTFRFCFQCPSNWAVRSRPESCRVKV